MTTKYMNTKILLALFMFPFLPGIVAAQTNFCASSGNSQQYEWMYYLRLGTAPGTGGVINLGSGTRTGYHDGSATALATVEAGSTLFYEIRMNSTASYHQHIFFWLDTNQDGELVDPGERAHTTEKTVNGVTTHTGSFTVPAATGNGTVFGRVIMRYLSAPPLCGSYDFGTTFDFRIDVTGGVNYNQTDITVNVEGTGTVVSDPAGVNTSTSQTSNFTQNREVAFTASGSGSQVFSHWSGAITGTNNPGTLYTGTHDTLSLTAHFTDPCTTVSMPTASVSQLTPHGASLTWSSTTGTPPITYNWNVRRADDDVSAQSGSTEQTQISISGLQPNTTYFLQVYASNCGGDSAVRTTDEFTTLRMSQDAPETVTFDAPTFGQSETLTWSRVSTADEGYRVKVDRGAGFVYYVNVPQTVEGNLSTTIPAEEFESMGTRRFRVRAEQTDTRFSSAYTTSAQQAVQKADQSFVSVAVEHLVRIYGESTTVTAAGGSGSGAFEFRHASGTADLSLSGTGDSRDVITLSTGSAVLEARRLGDANYNDSPWVAASGLTVEPRPLTGRFTVESPKVYDDTTAATVLTRSLDGVLEADEKAVWLIGGEASFADKFVGTGKEVNLVGSSLTGSAAANYTLAEVVAVTADIVPGPPANVIVVWHPGRAVAGVPVPGDGAAASRVLVTDMWDNPVLAGIPVTVSPQPIITPESTLSADTDATGHATFANLIIETAGQDYTIEFTAGDMPE